MSSAFKLLYFRGSRLDRFEIIEADGPVEALQEAANRPSDDLVELWADDRKLATFRPVRRQG
jgi:hypothetical protein